MFNFILEEVGKFVNCNRLYDFLTGNIEECSCLWVLPHPVTRATGVPAHVLLVHW